MSLLLLLSKAKQAPELSVDGARIGLWLWNSTQTADDATTIAFAIGEVET